MNLPVLLSQRLHMAATVLAQQGVVPVWYRQSLYAAFGARYHKFSLAQPISESDQVRFRIRKDHFNSFPTYEDAPVRTIHRTAGHTRRIALMLHTLMYAHTHIRGWSSSAYSYAIDQYLEAMRMVLYGAEWTELQIPAAIGHYDAYAPGDLVLAAAGYAWEHLKRDTEYLLHPLEPVRDDRMLAPFQLDTAELVAVAIEDQATNLVSRPVDFQRPTRQLFWHWWLGEAIPTAWRAIPSTIV